MIKNFKLTVLIILLLLNHNLFGQRITSEKKSIKITTGLIEINVVSPGNRGFKPLNKKYDYPVVDNKSVEVIVDIKGGIGSKIVKINEVEATQFSDGNYYKQVTLFTGENIIKISAEDSRGNSAEKSIKVICSYQYDIEVNNGKYFALIIGVNDYEDESLTDLSRPIADGNKLKELLIKQYTFNRENVIFLENPKRSDLIKGFEQIVNKVHEEDNLLIFYAGHGVWDEDKEMGYWLPVDADAVITDNWFRNSAVKDFISAIDSKHTILITDACFGGSIFRMRGVGANPLSAYNKLYKLQSRKGMTSGTLEKVPDKSVFIKYLLEKLEQNEDKYLPAAMLFNSIRDAVLNNSPNVPQYGVIQGVGDEGGEFIFIKR